MEPKTKRKRETGMTKKQNKIMIVEDDPDIREGIRIFLEIDGYAVVEAENGSVVLAKLDASFSLVVLDVMMPGMSGLKTCEEIRKVSYVPILFLTAKSNESDKLVGLMAGGDDYLTKPFSYAEFLGRVKALLRSYETYGSNRAAEVQNIQDPIIRRGEIAINCARNEVTVAQQEVYLTNIEYQILLLLMQYPQKIFSAQNLYESVWKEPFDYASSSTVMVHIRKIRIKIEKDPISVSILPKRAC